MKNFLSLTVAFFYVNPLQSLKHGKFLSSLAITKCWMLLVFGLALLLEIAAVILGLPNEALIANTLVILTTGAAVLTSKDATYLPQFIGYTATTQLTGVKVTTLDGGVICDLDATGLTALRGILRKGVVTNGTVIQLANGLIPAKNILFEFTNSAAQTPTIFAWSEEQYPQTPYYIQSIRTKAFANVALDISDFAYVSMPSMAAADQVNIYFKDGLTQTVRREELQYSLMDSQNEVNTPNYAIDNTNQRIVRVQFIGVADQTLYIVRFVSSQLALMPATNV
jgi:hypothetical protein